MRKADLRHKIVRVLYSYLLFFSLGGIFGDMLHVIVSNGAY